MKDHKFHRISSRSRISLQCARRAFRARIGGMALPICWMRLAALPANSNPSGNVCSRAHSRNVRSRSSVGCTNFSRCCAVDGQKAACVGIEPFQARGRTTAASLRALPSITRRKARRRNDSCCRCSGRSFIVWPVQRGSVCTRSRVDFSTERANNDRSQFALRRADTLATRSEVASRKAAVRLPLLPQHGRQVANGG